MNLMTIASMAITGSLLVTMQVGTIPYTVALSPATVAYQQSAIDGVSSVTQSPFNPVVSPYRSTGSPIILGGGGTRLYLKPELPTSIARLPAHAIARAELRIPVAQRAASATSGSVMYGSYQINQGWSPASGSSFMAPAASSSPFATSSLYYDATPNRNSGLMQMLSFDVTWLVREWAKGAPNHGIMVRELNSGQTYGLWWEAPNAAQPELVVTVYSDYLPNSRPPESPPMSSHSPSYPADPYPGVAVTTQPIDASVSWSGGFFGKEVTIQKGNSPVERFHAAGVQGEFGVSLGALQLQLEAAVGGVDELVDPSISLQPKEGMVGEFAMLGSVAISLGGGTALAPGLGIFADSHSLTFGSYSDRNDHSRTIGGLLLTSEWRFEPVPNTSFSARVAASPLAATTESFRRSQGTNWVQEEVDEIYTTWLEGRLSAKLQLLPHVQLTAGYASAASFIPAQRASYTFTNSMGDYVTGTSDIERSVMNSSRGYVGVSYFF